MKKEEGIFNVRRGVKLPERQEGSNAFDPERDITREDWDGMLAAYEKLPPLTESYERLRALASLKILGRPIELHAADRAVLEDLRSAILAGEIGYDVHIMQDEIQYLKILDPTFNLPTEKFEQLRRFAAADRHNGDWDGVADILYIFKLFSLPDKPFGDIMEGILDCVETHREYLGIAGISDEFDEQLLPLLMHLKFLIPDTQVATAEDWKEIRGELSKARAANDYAKFATLAADMAIVAAKSVKISDKGIEFGISKKRDETIAPFPAASNLP